MAWHDMHWNENTWLPLPTVFVRALLLGALMPLQWEKTQKGEKGEGFTKVPQNPTPPPPPQVNCTFTFVLFHCSWLWWGGVGWGFCEHKKKKKPRGRPAGRRRLTALLGWRLANPFFSLPFSPSSFSFLLSISFSPFYLLFLLSISSFSFLSPFSPFYLPFKRTATPFQQRRAVMF